MNQVNGSYKFKNTYNIGFESSNCGSDLTVLYIHGFTSSPWERRAEFIKKCCLKENLNFFRFELIGHGSDKDDFCNGNFNLWTEQILDIIDNKITGPILLVAHCIGAGTALIAVTKRPKRFAGIITTALGINVSDLIAQKMRLADWRKMYREGYVKTEDKEFVFTKEFILTGLENHLSPKKLSGITCPFFLLHGTEDNRMPRTNSLNTAAYLGSKTIIIGLVSTGHHFRDRKSLTAIKFAITKMNQYLKSGAS